MNNQSGLSPRIAIYGTGFVGQALTRLCVKKDWEIVAAYNRAGQKVGQDLGRLAGLDRDLGVRVQDSETADYANLDADIALIASTDRLKINFPVYERFFKAGVNVLCHGGESYNPKWANKEIASKIDRLAKQHGVTFTGSGLWDMTRLWAGIIVAGPCVEIESLIHTSETEVARQGLHLIPIAGIGMTVEQYDEEVGREAGPFSGIFHILCITVLEALGYTISNYKVSQEPILWDEPVYCEQLKQELAPGTVLGTRLNVNVNSQEGVSANARLEYRVFKEGETEEMRWKVNGTPGMEIRVIREDSGIASASSLFNRIPDVIAAEPGLVELVRYRPELPSDLL
jgi:4-hydroxy-tetrahydrodipicolinate reductase